MCFRIQSNYKRVKDFKLLDLAKNRPQSQAVAFNNGTSSTLMCRCNIETSNDITLQETNGVLIAFSIAS